MAIFTLCWRRAGAVLGPCCRVVVQFAGRGLWYPIVPICRFVLCLRGIREPRIVLVKSNVYVAHVSVALPYVTLAGLVVTRAVDAK